LIWGNGRKSTEIIDGPDSTRSRSPDFQGDMNSRQQRHYE